VISNYSPVKEGVFFWFLLHFITIVY